MAQPVYAAHPLRTYLAREHHHPAPASRGLLLSRHTESGEAEIMPGGSHDFAYDDDDDGGGAGKEDEEDEESNAGRARKRRRRAGIDWAAAALAGAACLALSARKHTLGAVLGAGAGYPHVRARIHAYAHDLAQPRPVVGEPPPEETWASIAATFDRDQASAWAEQCCFAAAVMFMFGLRELAGLILAGSLYPYLDVILPVGIFLKLVQRYADMIFQRLQRMADDALLYLHATLPPVPIHAAGGSSLMTHVISIRKEECAHWAEACLLAACLPLLFRSYSLSFSVLSAALYPYLDAVLPASVFGLVQSSI